MPKGRVLAVDDQRYFRELIEGLLREEDYAVETASSGEEALERLGRADFDVVITDLVMPVMSGTDLVHRIKERDPEQDVIVVTGVVDVQSAVEAMKIGADDYLLKPFDRQVLSSSLDHLMRHRRLQRERDRLLAENIEYMGERSLFERALDLFEAVTLDGLAQKILEGLEAETGAQGGVLWLEAEPGGPLALTAARGLVRVEEERGKLPPDALPEAIREPDGLRCAGADRDRLLWIALRRGDARIGAVRLTDKLGDERFDEIDRACAEKFAEHAERAIANLSRFQSMERQSLQDPATGAYRIDYLRDVVRNEIEKANRFGRSFGLAVIGVSELDALRRSIDESAFEGWWSGFVQAIGRQLRATDFLAVDAEHRVWVRLAESDAIGAATFKRRTRLALEACDALGGLPDSARVEIATAIYPRDAVELDALENVLLEGLGRDGQRSLREADLEQRSFGECLHALLDEGACEADADARSLLRFSAAEVGRRPRERNLFFLRAIEGDPDPVDRLVRPVHDHGTEIIVIGEPDDGLAGESEVAFLPPERIPGCPPFALHYGDGPAYVLVGDQKAEGDGRRLFHSSDPALAEYLVFRLQRELRLPTLA